jgi:hypothetical protein
VSGRTIRTKRRFRVSSPFLSGTFTRTRQQRSIEDCEYVIERHRMNRQQLRSLIMRPHFDADAIRECLAKGPNYEDKYYEDTIREDETEPYYQENRYEVLEYWGVLDAKFATR